LLLLLKIPLGGFTSVVPYPVWNLVIPCYLVARKTKRASPVNVRKLKNSIDGGDGHLLVLCAQGTVASATTLSSFLSTPEPQTLRQGKKRKKRKEKKKEF